MGGPASLTNIDKKTPSLGQAAMVASSPVVIANNQSALPIASALFVINGSHTKNTALSSSFTLTPPGNANAILIQATVQNVRYTLDGTTPTATTGFILRAYDDPRIIDISAGMTVKIIEETSGAIVNYQWGRI